MIGSNAMLVELNISIWTARKLDKQVSEEVDNAKGTRARAGNYHKNLLAGSDKLEEIQRIASAARVWQTSRTLPWSDKGARLLPMRIFFDYKQQLTHYETQFNQAVEEFLAEYPQLVSAAAFKLGALFDRDEYPDVDKIRNKFSFSYGFSPVPEAGDFRVNVEKEALDELKSQYEQQYTTKLNDAMKDTWERLHTVLKHLSTKLDYVDDAVDASGNKIRAPKFYTSNITNVTELCGLLTALNVTNDPKLEEARKQVEIALTGIDADIVKESQDIRHNVKAKVDAILDMFN